MGILTKAKIFFYKILALLWVIALVYLLFVVNVGKSTEQAVVLLVLVISFICFKYALKTDEEKKVPSAFINQLKDNRDEIMSSGWTYEGMLIEKNTIVTQFYFTYSLVTVSHKIPSRFYIVGQENTVFINFIYTFCSLVLGWWAIPDGPIFTLQTLYSNLKGGNNIRVGDIVELK